MLDRWGDNTHFELTGNVNTAKFITVISKIPLLTGKTVRRVAVANHPTCAEHSDNNTICWGRLGLQRASKQPQPGLRRVVRVILDQPGY